MFDLVPFTTSQLQAWAGCTQKDPEPITQDMWNERVALFAEAKLHAPALARLVLERDAEIAELKAAALDLISQCHASIRITGIHYTPVISTRFNRSVELLLETINKPRQAMKETSDE